MADTASDTSLNTPLSAAVEPAPDAAAATERFLDDLAQWVDACIAEYRDEPATANHDQLTYTSSWLALTRARPTAAASEAALHFLTQQRDQVHAAHRQADRWHHGYWRRQEVHHGTEHFEIFLANHWRLFPDDEVTVRDFLDAAEHLGNWAADVPAWFDHDTGLFRSMFLGTELVGRDDRPEHEHINVPDHFRCVNMALIAHAMSGDQRYLELAHRHGRCWAEAINHSADLPQAIGPEGAINAMSNASHEAYRSFAGQSAVLTERVNRAENLLCSDAVTALLRLWQQTGDAALRTAAERVLDELATQLHDPDAGPAADALRRYRRMTGDHRYDAALREAVAALSPFEVRRLTLVPDTRGKPRPSGIGKRSDMPSWREDDAPARHNPILLACAAEITGDDELMRVALDLGRARFALARRLFPAGRHHGCTARSVSAIARGHGRDNHVGVVTGVLAAHLETHTLPDGSPAQPPRPAQPR